jgi:hypothetical protein
MLAPHELHSLLETILSRKEEGEKINRLPEVDAQALIDVIDEARSTLLVIACLLTLACHAVD